MIDILRNRRSARKFSPTPIPKPVIDVFKEALLRSASSKNNRPWQFVFVEDKQMLETLSKCKPHGAAFLKNAALAVVILGDEEKSDVWVEDCSIAAINLQYVAQTFDVGSCWVQVRLRNHDDTTSAEQYVVEQLNIPSHLKVASIIGLGYRLEHRAGVPFEKLEFQKCHDDTFK